MKIAHLNHRGFAVANSGTLNVQPGQKQINFRGLEEQSDSFETLAPKVEVLKGEMDEAGAKEIVASMTPENLYAESKKRSVYKIGDKIAKIVAPGSEKTFVTAENFALTMLEKEGLPYAANPKALLLVKGGQFGPDAAGYVQVQDFVDAKSIGLAPENYTKEAFGRLFASFLEMDKHGIANSNLTPENIAFTPDKGVRFFNFGDLGVIDDYGDMVRSKDERMAINRFFEIVTKPAESRFASSFSKLYKMREEGLKTHILFRSENPYLAIYSNVSNYETQTLHSFLTDKNCQNPLETFREYIKTKAEMYHTGMQGFLKSLEGIMENGARRARGNYLAAVDFQEVLDKVLSNPDDSILKAEAAKIQFRKTLTEDKGACKGEFSSAYNALKNAFSQLAASNDEAVKKYAEANVFLFEKLFRRLCGHMVIPEAPIENNLLVALFPDAYKNAPAVAETVAESVKETAQTAKEVLEASVPKAEEVLRGAAESVKENIKETAGQTASNIKDTVPAAADAAAQVVKTASKTSKSMKGPIAAIGAVVFAGGAVAFKILTGKDKTAAANALIPQKAALGQASMQNSASTPSLLSHAIQKSPQMKNFSAFA